MKKIKYICNAALLALVALGLWSCKYDPYETDVPKVEELMNLKASAAAIALDENNLKDNIITFDWSDARLASDDHVITYTTKLDVVGNNFGSTTVIQQAEDDGVFTKSFTSEQLNIWANKLWKIPVNKKFTLEFRVSAQWMGGPTFEIPEVKTVTVEVTPIKVIVFEADKVLLGGNAMAEETELKKTVENANLYAWVGDLTIGDLMIPVKLNDKTYYICPADGDKTLKDGKTIKVIMQENPIAWDIKTAGKYRVVIDMQKTEVTIYSPATDLQPLSVTFKPNGDETQAATTVVVTDLYVYGDPSWSTAGKKLNCTQSLADPQILIYSGGGMSGRAKFPIVNSFGSNPSGKPAGTPFNCTNAFAFTAPLKADGTEQDVPVVFDEWLTVESGSDRPHRQSYVKLPGGTNFIIFDLRNSRIKASKK